MYTSFCKVIYFSLTCTPIGIAKITYTSVSKQKDLPPTQVQSSSQIHNQLDDLPLESDSIWVVLPR